MPPLNPSRDREGAPVVAFFGGASFSLPIRAKLGLLFVPSYSHRNAAQGNLPAPGNARLCLRVDSVEQTLKELQTKGVRTGAAVHKDSGVLGSFEDPDGNEICLWQYLQPPPGCNARRLPMAGGFRQLTGDVDETTSQVEKCARTKPTALVWSILLAGRNVGRESVPLTDV